MLFRNVRMTVAAILIVAAACQRVDDGEGSQVLSTGIPVGDVRGTTLVNKLIQTRMLDAEADSSVSFEIEKLAGPQIHTLKTLLGQYSEGAAHADYRGGEPNPFGLLLWHQVIARFAEGLSNYCAAPASSFDVSFFDGTTAKLHASFAAKIKAACGFEGDVETRKATAVKLWRGFVGLAAAGEEASFAEAFASAESPFAVAAPKERVEAMVIAMMLNPHFLLEN